MTPGQAPQPIPAFEPQCTCLAPSCNFLPAALRREAFLLTAKNMENRHEVEELMGVRSTTNRKRAGAVGGAEQSEKLRALILCGSARRQPLVLQGAGITNSRMTSAARWAQGWCCVWAAAAVCGASHPATSLC